MMPNCAARNLARFVDVYCDQGAFTVAQARRYLEAARALGFDLKLHAGQFSSDGGVALAAELGAAKRRSPGLRQRPRNPRPGRVQHRGHAPAGAVFHLACIATRRFAR